jgi:hypothetical protein
LFHLQKDPQETQNLLTAKPQLARRLQDRLEKILTAHATLAQQLGADVSGQEVEITDEAKQRLRALGY